MPSEALSNAQWALSNTPRAFLSVQMALSSDQKGLLAVQKGLSSPQSRALHGAKFRDPLHSTPFGLIHIHLYPDFSVENYPYPFLVENSPFPPMYLRQL